MDSLTCNRRYFLQLTIAAFTLGDLSRLVADPTPGGTTMDLGLATDFPTDKDYLNFYDKGWFLVRKDGKYFALTDVCPHKGGPLIAQPDGTFTCKWHHATFDAVGHVTKKPAKVDLLVYPVNQDDKGHLIVTLPALVKLPPKPKPSPTPAPAGSGGQTPVDTTTPAPMPTPAPVPTKAP